MASKITYDDKISLTTSALPRANKCTDDDLNEIKQVVNDNADKLDENTANIEGLQGTILYESNDGTSENITLTDDSNNYNFIDVSFFGNNGSTDITRVYDISKGVNLLTANCNSSGTKIWFQTETITFLNNQLVRGTQAEVLLQQGVSIVPYSTTIKIFKVVGYK